MSLSSFFAAVKAAASAVAGHTPTSAQAAVDKVFAARDKAVAIEQQVVTAITEAQQIRVATLAAVHNDIAAFEAIKKSLGK